MKGLSVQITEEAVFLVFESSTGKSAMVNVDVIAESRPPIAKQAIQEWAADLRRAEGGNRTV